MMWICIFGLIGVFLLGMVAGFLVKNLIENEENEKELEMERLYLVSVRGNIF